MVVETPVAAKEPVVHRWTVEDYERMSELGLLPLDLGTELIDGVVYEKVTQNEPHARCLERLTAAVYRRLIDRVRVRVQAPLRMAPWDMPEPDLLIIRADAPDERHPVPTDMLVAVEVSDTSLSFDRNHKLPRYAAHGVPQLWILVIRSGQVEVHNEPSEDRYLQTRTYRSGETVPVPGLADVGIPVDEIFPG
ncbi:MAG TPA: Uma2 family endonuclease [Chloroflexota bacterium]|nr:Uma2 family endonuclease [Chloroflexota bacterium]